MSDKLFFNILTFDYPKKAIDFYFSLADNGKASRLHKTLYPKNINSIFPNVTNDPDSDFIYTTFIGETESFTKLSIDFKTENIDLLKRFYNGELNYYFNKIKQQVVRTGFIRETQVWLPVTNPAQSEFSIYDKFSVKVQFHNVSDYPELLVSYDGQSKVFRRSIADLIQSYDASNFNWVLYGNKLWKYKTLLELEEIEYDKVFPVLGKQLKNAIGYPTEAPPRDNRYKNYLTKIKSFSTKFFKDDDFLERIPLHTLDFFNVPASKLNTTTKDSNLLTFGKRDNTTGIDYVPYNGIKSYGPFKKSPYPNVQLFFIFHSSNLEGAKKLNQYLSKGLGFFKGLTSFSQVLFHTKEGFSIPFSDMENPIAEIESQLSNRTFDDDVKYIAIYITPFSKFDSDSQKRKIYYKVKEQLLKRKITSQCIDADKVIQGGDNYVFSLANIAVAMLAKLDGVPWRLNTPIKNELIVGIGAFKQVDTDTQYIGSAFSFNNTGGFNRFEYFLRSELEILAGSIVNAVREFTTLNNLPDRLIIHFYKTMSDRELEPILTALNQMGLSIPVFIITINKTESEDIVLFDGDWANLMPVSGTFVNIGNNRFLLCNNTRYSNNVFKESEGFPFPIKLKIDCSDKNQLQEPLTIKGLIDQVYQFSRIYWKSVKQQNLPITIKYPEMVAQIAPHFDGDDIPQFGKDNLWFL